MSAIEVRLHGVRGSIPTPTSSPEIEGKIRSALRRATPDDIKDDASIDAFIGGMEKVEKGCIGGNSTCIQITIGEHELFFDAGSGCFAMAKTLFGGPFGRGQGEAHWFFHPHTPRSHRRSSDVWSDLYPGKQL